MKYLLDTDTVSFAVRARPIQPVVERLSRTPTEELATSAITVGEIWFGVYRRAQRRDALWDRLSALLSGLTVLPFDNAAALVYADRRTLLERDGLPIDEADLRIAAVALANDLTVVTGNVRHFSRVAGLRLENWLKPGDAR